MSIEAKPARAPWIAVATHPHREAYARDNLLRQSFRAYSPVIVKRVRHARTVRDERRPLFPGYVFVQLDPAAERWRSIRSTYGVRDVVQFGQRPAYVDRAFIDGLRAREIDGVVVASVASFAVGQNVRVIGGPLDGLVATIIGMGERERLVVLMDMLNQSVRVSIDARHAAAV